MAALGRTPALTRRFHAFLLRTRHRNPAKREPARKCAQVAAEVAAAFPPRGIIRLLPVARTGGDRPALDRLIAEEYILDTIFFFDGNRVDCAGRLAFGAPSGGLGGVFANRAGTECCRPCRFCICMQPEAHCPKKLLPVVPRPTRSHCCRMSMQRCKWSSFVAVTPGPSPAKNLLMSRSPAAAVRLRRTAGGAAVQPDAGAAQAAVQTHRLLLPHRACCITYSCFPSPSCTPTRTVFTAGQLRSVPCQTSCMFLCCSPIVCRMSGSDEVAGPCP